LHGRLDLKRVQGCKFLLTGRHSFTFGLYFMVQLPSG